MYEKPWGIDEVLPYIWIVPLVWAHVCRWGIPGNRMNESNRKGAKRHIPYV